MIQFKIAQNGPSSSQANQLANSQNEYFRKSQQAFDQLIARTDLGFFKLPHRDENWSASHHIAQGLVKKYKNLVVIGMGGSSLGGRAIIDAFNKKNVQFIMNTDPETLERFFVEPQVLKSSQFLVISKSGNTLEIAAILSTLCDRLKKEGRRYSEAITVVTEPKPSPLYNWALKHDVPMCAHPTDVGGRFSVLSPVGMLPADFAGLNTNEIRDGAIKALEDKDICSSISAFYLSMFEQRKTISVFWSYKDRLNPFLPWLQQLWAESLGKKMDRNNNPCPTVSTPLLALGAMDQHSVLQQFMEGARDKSVLFFDVKKVATDIKLQQCEWPELNYINNQSLHEIYNIQSDSTQKALEQVNVPTARITVDEFNETSLGYLFMMFELVIGVLGEALNINAFDQPGVELGKILTQDKLKQL